LEGLVLHTPLKPEHVQVDPRAQVFLARAETQRPGIHGQGTQAIQQFSTPAEGP
jgi:hypothetical protein